MDDKTLEMTMLLDFYGEMLTDKQRECLDLYYNQDLSLSEIAQLGQISRQGVRDLLVRTEGYLTRLEEKLGILRRHLHRRQTAQRMRQLLQDLTCSEDSSGELGALLLEMESGGEAR